MALDPRLLGIARPVDIMGNIRQGIQDVQADQAFKLAQEQGALQNQILQQNVAAGDQAAIDAERERELQSVLAASNVIEPLLASGDPAKIQQAQNFLSVRSKQIASAGGNPEDTDELLGLINAGDTGTALNLVRNVQQLAPTADKPSQFSASSLVKDEGGNVYSVTEKRNPNTGSVEQVYSAITPNAPETPQGAISIVSRSTGLTGAETVEQAGQRTAVTEQAKQLEGLRSDIQTTFVKAGIAAKKGKNEILRMRDALKGVAQGRLAQARQSLGTFIPGIRDADAEAALSLMNQFILGKREEIIGGGVMSDADLAILRTVGVQLGNQPEANEKILDFMEAASDAAIKNAADFKAFLKGGGNAEDFVPADRLSGFAQTAQPEPVTIDPNEINRLLEKYGN